ncbi:MAG: class I SAM-dependent methyltransferase [Thermanaerothrix sp.]|nr:class I SAM-dependent methyltransferase [Thermanaerothrix sp.]
MIYTLSKKYENKKFMDKIMGPNPIKLAEELLTDHKIPKDAVICDLGSGNGVTSVFMASEYGFTVYALDLWSDPEENQEFFNQFECKDRLIAVKGDANQLPFEKNFFDAIVSVDSYNYFGRDPRFLDEKIMDFLKPGGLIYIAIPGMKKDLHDNPPSELLLSWTKDQLDYIHDISYWRSMVENSKKGELLSIREMQSFQEVWDDWLKLDNQYAVSDRKAFQAGGGKYFNFISMVLRRH